MRKSEKSASEHHSVQPVADEVHCMDLKAQVALQRLCQSHGYIYICMAA